MKINTKISENWLKGMALACMQAASNESNANQPGTKIVGAIVVLITSDGSIGLAGSRDPAHDATHYEYVQAAVTSALTKENAS